MSDLVSRFASLNLEDITLKRRVQGYFLRLKNSNDFFLISRNKICIKDIPGKSYILLERKLTKDGDFYIVCPLCMNVNAINKISNLNKDDIAEIRSKRCEHALVCDLLWEKEDLHKSGMGYYDPSIDVVEVLDVQKDYIAIVHPSNKKCRNFPTNCKYSSKECWYIHEEPMDVDSSLHSTNRGQSKFHCDFCQETFAIRSEFMNHKKSITQIK